MLFKISIDWKILSSGIMDMIIWIMLIKKKKRRKGKNALNNVYT